jgi:hypothetical protein
MLVPTGSERASTIPRSGCTMFILFRFINISKDLTATANCFAIAMEQLFSPCTRVRDIAESLGRLRDFRGDDDSSDDDSSDDDSSDDDSSDDSSMDSDNFEYFRELNLDVSTDEFLSADKAFTYVDLHAMLGNESTVAWLTPHAAVANGRRVLDSWRQVDESSNFRFNADGKELYGLARSNEHLLEICIVVLRLLAASVVQSVHLDNWGRQDIALINAASLAYLMEQCQSLKVLTLEYLKLDEDQCRVLGVHSRPDLEIVLDHCKLTRAGASALAEVLGRNQGPTRLNYCSLDYFVLANGLRGNSRLNSLRPRISSNFEVGNRQVLAIAGALRENKGLVDLNLSSCWVIDETWNAVCDSLKTHPTLEVLDLRAGIANNTTAPALITSRMQALANMLKLNTSIHTLHLEYRYSKHELYRGSIVPYLETNRLRPHVHAIQKARSITYRAKVLGRALLETRTDVNSFWMILSGNPEVVFSLTTATTTPATKLSTPAAVGASANAAPVVAITAATSNVASITGADAATPAASATGAWGLFCCW